jgi:RNA polymerase sigma factor (sigma-70 family)
MRSDAELLLSYIRDHSDGAFTELVKRHIDLVYSAAWREARGNASAAEDITQAVFVELARQAARVSRHPALAGWLYTCVRHISANLRRAEERRHRRELEAASMNEIVSTDSPEAAWRQLQPVLDDAMHELSETDRTAVVLRFFEERSLREVGLALDLNENAARMRVERALGKLRALLAKRGVTSTAAGLTAALGVGAVSSAPSGLAATVAAGALAATAAATTSTTVTLLKLMTLTKIKLGLLSAVVVAGLTTPLVLQHQSQARLREENAGLRQQLEQMTHVSAENERLSNLVAQAERPQTLSSQQLSELLRLRGEVGGLRRQLTQATNAPVRLRQANPMAEPQTDEAIELQRQAAMGRAKMSYAKDWVLAFHLFAVDHAGQYPTNFDQAEHLLPEAARGQTNLTTADFELLYQGPFDALTNPAKTIVMRERQAHQSSLDGRWAKTYGFADGHSELHVEPDNNFEPWENAHLPSSPGQ